MKKLDLLLVTLGIVLASITIYQSTLGEATNERVPEGTLIQLEGIWSDVWESDAGEQLITCNYQISPGRTFSEALLYIESYWKEFEVLSNGKSLYNHFDKNDDGYAHLVTLERLYNGERISITFRLKNTENLDLLKRSYFYIGDQSGIYNKVLGDNLYAFIYALLTVVLTVVTFGMEFMLRRSKVAYQALTALGLFILTTGIWVLTDSQLLLLVTGRTSTVSLVSFLSFFVMPLFLLSFTERMMTLDVRVYRALMGIYIILFDIYAANHIFEWYNGTLLLLVEHAVSLVTMAVILGFGLREQRQIHDVKLKCVLTGYVIFCIGSVVGMLLFYARPFSGYSRAYALGTAGFILCLFDAACHQMYEQLEQNADLRLRAKFAYMDIMTGLGNRAAFHEQQIKDLEHNGPIAYLVVDVNNLKVTNDTLGHAMGDQLIIRTAQCLKAAVANHGTSYRIGGDEFVACLKNETKEQAQECLTRFYQLIEEDNKGRELKLSAAAGSAWRDVSAIPAPDLDALFREADAAMYEEKQRVKSAGAFGRARNAII